MSVRKPTRKQVGKNKSPSPEASEGRRYPEEGEALHKAITQPWRVLGLKTEAFVEWALPKIEASRCRRKISAAKLDQNQRNLLTGLILEALTPLVQDVRTTKDRLRRIDHDHAAAILLPLMSAVDLLQALHDVTVLDAPQKSIAGHALRMARKAEKEVLVRSSNAWRKRAKPNLGRRAAWLSAELVHAFGISQTAADPIAAKVMEIDVREIQKARE